MSKLTYQVWSGGGISLWCLAIPALSQAQITSDGTLSTEVTTSDNFNFTITGSSRSGGNLFHSFREFSIPNEGSAVFDFDNAMDVENIFSRVTGSSVSNINGLIKAKGSANLFLLNPNGIVFGPNAKLEIGGSFLASTADRLNFADGRFFSANDRQTQPLLTVSVPLGLQFGATAERIVNQSVATDSDGEYVGLQVKPDKTLALVGGDVFLESGILSVPEGRIEIGSVADSSLVSLTPIAAGWFLGYNSVQNFQDIQLSQESYIDTTGTSNGDIRLYGRKIAITDGSQVGGFNLGANLRGTLSLKATEAVEVSGSLFNEAEFTGAAGDIKIETRHLLVRDGADIRTSSNSYGRGGNISVDASESVEIRGNGLYTPITTQAYADGNAGDVRITTKRLILQDGGLIGSSTRGTGNGGTITVNASELVEASGQGKAGYDADVRSDLLSRTIGSSATGNGGIIKIDTGRLLVQGGASISVAAVEGSTGQAGSLDINALDSVKISGNGSSVLAASESPKPAGDLKISTNELIVQDGAEVSVSSQGTGNAGNLEVTADSISLENGGKLTSTSKLGRGGGNIKLKDVNLLLLHDNSEISTNATAGTGNGGDINIDTDLLIGLENSDITANAIEGRGGKIRINAQGIFGIEPRSKRNLETSDITAFSEKDSPLDGVIEINRPEADPNADLVILPAEIVDISGLVAQGCPAGGGNLAAGRSQFVITGRGGLPPNPAEATRSDMVLADLGKLVTGKENRARTRVTINATNSEPMALVEATGWVAGPKGEVVLTATAPSITSDIPWLMPNSCNRS